MANLLRFIFCLKNLWGLCISLDNKLMLSDDKRNVNQIIKDLSDAVVTSKSSRIASLFVENSAYKFASQIIDRSEGVSFSDDEEPLI